jgi:hypothetical protein
MVVTARSELKGLRDEMIELEKKLRAQRKKAQVSLLQAEITGLEMEIGSLSKNLTPQNTLRLLSSRCIDSTPQNQEKLPALNANGSSAVTSRTHLLKSEIFGKILQKAVHALKRQAATR